MPRKLKADSVRIAPPIPSVATTYTGDKALGKTCRKIILLFGNPMAFAARTYSLFLMLNISALTRRAIPIQFVRPMTIMIFQMLGSRTAMTARIRKKVGKHIIRSTKRIMSSSTMPPVYPENAPIIMPIRVAIPTDTKPTRRDILLP